MATDSTHSGWNPLANNTNYNNFKYPRAQCGNYGKGNNDSRGNISVITPRITRERPENQAYAMPPTDYGKANNDSRGNIPVITPRITLGKPENQAYAMPPTGYGKANNDSRGNIPVITPRITLGKPENQAYAMPPPDYGKGNISVITPRITRGRPENQAYAMPPPDYGKGNISVITTRITLGKPEADTMPPPDYTHGLEEILEENCFSDASIRRGFVRKVYFTLTIQLLITVGIICAFLYWNDLKIWTLKTYWFTLATGSATLVIIMVLGFCGDIRRKIPLNYILLGLFTIVEGLMLGSVTVFFSAEPVLWAVGATAFVCFTLTLFTLQTKWKFAGCNGFLWVLFWSLISFGILCAILRSQYVNIVYAWLGTALFSVYLVVDTQLILGGNHKHSVDPEEYIFAALTLYLDIVLIFLYILQLFGQSES
ncbi:protein lifeguard 2-like [Alosa alosa]|uniref:protein lifeguard 2-like n=1 Tax=Alosa alosa TaxID=278164 RepID=UPI00201506C2|nr:protein lifeguard 2-like [Alosa alosa]